MDKKYVIVVASLIVLIVLGISLLSTRPRGEEGRVDWVYDYDEGLGKAKTEGKLVLIDFYADWCGWCKKLDQETYSKQDVASFLNEKLVCIKIDVEKDVTLAENSNVSGLPTIVFLSSNGEEVGRIEGYRPPGQFLEYARDVVNQYG